MMMAYYGFVITIEMSARDISTIFIGLVRGQIKKHLASERQREQKLKNITTETLNTATWIQWFEWFLSARRAVSLHRSFSQLRLQFSLVFFFLHFIFLPFIPMEIPLWLWVYFYGLFFFSTLQMNMMQNTWLLRTHSHKFPFTFSYSVCHRQNTHQNMAKSCIQRNSLYFRENLWICSFWWTKLQIDFVRECVCAFSRFVASFELPIRPKILQSRLMANNFATSFFRHLFWFFF